MAKPPSRSTTREQQLPLQVTGADSTVLLDRSEVEAELRRPSAAAVASGEVVVGPPPGPRVLQMASPDGPEAGLVGVGDASQYPDPLATEPEPVAARAADEKAREVRSEVMRVVDLFNHAVKGVRLRGDAPRCVRLEAQGAALASHLNMVRARVVLLGTDPRQEVAPVVLGTVDLAGKSARLLIRSAALTEARATAPATEVNAQDFEEALKQSEAELQKLGFAVSRAAASTTQNALPVAAPAARVPVRPPAAPAHAPAAPGANGPPTWAVALLLAAVALGGAYWVFTLAR